MVGIKRPRVDAADNSDDNVHPSRKQRVEQEDGRAELQKVFNRLRDELPKIRLEATKDLMSILSTETPDQSRRIDYALTRLIKGVCSGAKASRPGFSVALTEVLRLSFDKNAAGHLTIESLVEKVFALTSPDGKAKGEELRNCLLGRQFALQAVLRSQILDRASEDDCSIVFDAISDLASSKQWLRAECGAGLCAYLKGEGEGENQFAAKNSSILLKSWAKKGLMRSPEGIALWLTCKRCFPDLKLPKGHWHHNNPLSSQERIALTGILSKNVVDEEESTTGAPKVSGARQMTPNFAWSTILEYLYSEASEKEFSQFWSECVAKSMFSSSSSVEKKSLGLQIFTRALATAPAQILQHVVHPNIMRCIVDQRVNSDRSLFRATKVPLDQIATRATKDSSAAVAIAASLLKSLSGSVDKFMKTTFETVLASIDHPDLELIVDEIDAILRAPGSGDFGEVEKKRRFLADSMLSLVRSRRTEPTKLFKDANGKPRASNIAQWLHKLVKCLAELGFVSLQTDVSPPISDTSREVLRERLMSIMTQVVTLPIVQAIWIPRIVVEVLHDARDSLTTAVDQASMKVLKNARKSQKDAIERAKDVTDEGPRTVLYAFHLLLSLSMLQVYRQEPDSLGVLQDTVSCYESPGDTNESVTMLVELILSFTSKQSQLYRKLAEQVFTAFAPEVTDEAFTSMIDILGQKESMAGQQELFDKHEDGRADEAALTEDSEDDIEDASDVEMINGEIASLDDESDSEGTDEENDGALDSSKTDEEIEFDRKLADALGTARTDQDSDEDGSDMDDDQMMALDSHLITIFQERKKGANKKQENKEAKNNIINFKTRVVDLFDIYVKHQYANKLALDLIAPLVELTRTTTDQPLAKKALTTLETYYDACKKNKTLPTGDSAQGLDMIANLLAEARLGGSKVHANACSRSSQFLAKMLVAEDPTLWVKVAHMYTSLQDEWRRDPKSKIHGSILNDWHNWSMQRQS